MFAISREVRAIDALIKEIPFIKDCRDIVKIDKGFSSDEKYKIRMPAEQATVLLRLFSAQELAQKKLEYAVMEQMQQLGIRCSKPLAIGKAGDKGYMITSYLAGEDAEYALPHYSPEEQFAVGFEAGMELRNMHQHEAPAETSSWAARKTAKHRKYLAAYAACGMKIRNDQKIIDFIEEHIHLMDGRPNLFQHDDYHPGNLIVKDGRFAGVVDFGRYDWGDPFHEFLKVGLFSRGQSIPFSVGQIKGYFHDSEPDDIFWKLYSLYLAMCVFSSVVWTLKLMPEDMDGMLEKIYQLLDDHDHFDRIKPKWYS